MATRKEAVIVHPWMTHTVRIEPSLRDRALGAARFFAWLRALWGSRP